MFDVAIVGTGPAGLSAALNLKLHNKSIVWFGSPALSTKVEKSELIANFPGIPMVSGPDLNAAFASQINDMGLEITDRMVTNIGILGDSFMVLGGNDIYDARTVLLATGAVGAKGFKGELEFLGRGVSYCATCDGFLYKGKTIAVYCGDRQFEHEVAYLAELAEKVYLFTPYKDCGIDLPNVEHAGRRIAEVVGQTRVEGIVLGDSDNNGNSLAVDGVFVMRPAIAPGVLLNGLAVDGAHIVVDRQQRTNVPGVFAAGDCTGRPYQLAKSLGEGNVAAHSIIEYLAASS